LSGGEQAAIGIEGDGTDRALLVAAMMLGGMFVGFAFHPGFVLRFANHFLAFAELDSVFDGEALGSLGDEHHVRAIFEDFAGDLNGIFYALQRGGGTGAECCAVHHDGVAFDVAVEIEVRAVAGVEDGVIFEDHDGGFNGVKRGTSVGEDGPAGG
jgi:hypothetical protein